MVLLDYRLTNTIFRHMHGRQQRYQILTVWGEKGRRILLVMKGEMSSEMEPSEILDDDLQKLELY